MRLLIVDDHILFREGLAALLRSQPDIKIIGLLGSVEEAVAVAAEQSPDMILMDFELPDGSGAEATRAILSKCPDIKVIFLTVHDSDDKLLAAIRSGAKGYLLKNSRPEKLISAIRTVQQGEPALSGSMTIRVMEELARVNEPDRPGDATLEKLSRRELDVLQELATGATNLEIAQRLYLSENTVKSHIHSILEKLGLSDRKAATKYALQHHLVK